MRAPDKPTHEPARPEIEVFGFKVNPMMKSDFIEFVAWHIARRRRVLVTHLNLHGMATMYRSATMTRLMRRHDAIVTIDGMSVVVLSRLAGHRITHHNRVTSLDYIDDMLKRAVADGWNIYYVGGEKDVLQRGLDYFRSHYPGLSIDGHIGYFDVNDHASDSVKNRLLAEINRRKTDLLIVGMGMPRQEEWVDMIRDEIGTPVIVTIGAMLEYFAGSLPMPPRWLGPLGLEWLFRLASAPRRLAYRYLVEPFKLLGRLRRGAPHETRSDEVGPDEG